MKIVESLIRETKSLQEFCIEKIHKGYDSKISNNESRLICEALRSIYNIIQSVNIEPHNKILLEKTYLFSLKPVYDKLFYYTAYYYSYQKIAKGDLHEKQESFFLINVNTATMCAVIDSFELSINGIGGSTDDYCFERMIKVTWAIKYIIKEELDDLYIPTFYVLFNLSQLLSKYTQSSHSVYQTKVDELKDEVLKLIDNLKSRPRASQILHDNFQLQLFDDFQEFLHQTSIGQPTDEKDYSDLDLSEMKTENILRILSSLAVIKPGLFCQLFDDLQDRIEEDLARNRIGLNNFLFTHCLASYLKISNYEDVIEFDLDTLSDQSVDFNNYIEDYFSNYSSSTKVEISEEELDILLKYSDDTLRSKFGATITNVDKHIVERESKKPHGAFEIADMEIPIKIDQKKYFMCLPFKSGLENSSPTVPVSVAYQIFRPFLHFNNCILVFVTAKRCSQNLMNYVKRMQDKLGWNIVVIENEELAKLLKINGQLN